MKKKLLFKLVAMITSIAMSMCSLFVIPSTDVVYGSEEQETQTTFWKVF